MGEISRRVRSGGKGGRIVDEEIEREKVTRAPSESESESEEGPESGGDIGKMKKERSRKKKQLQHVCV